MPAGLNVCVLKNAYRTNQGVSRGNDMLKCFIFAITVAGVVPCGGPKKSLRTSSIVQIIFSF